MWQWKEICIESWQNGTNVPENGTEAVLSLYNRGSRANVWPRPLSDGKFNTIIFYHIFRDWKIYLHIHYNLHNFYVGKPLYVQNKSRLSLHKDGYNQNFNLFLSCERCQQIWMEKNKWKGFVVFLPSRQLKSISKFCNMYEHFLKLSIPKLNA